MILIFISGVPRSGTTFFAGQISKRLNCAVLPEAHFKYDLIVEGKVSDRYEWESRIYKQYVDRKLFDDFTTIDEFYKRISDVLSKEVLIDHTPDNYRYYHLLKEISGFDVKFVNIIRDPRSSISSAMGMEWGPADIYDACRWYASCFSYISPALITQNSSVFKYEELVSDPDKVCQDLIREIGAASKSGESINLIPDYTKHQHKHAHEDVMKNLVNSSKDRLSDKELEVINYNFSSLITALGYSIEGGYATSSYAKQSIRKRLFSMIYKSFLLAKLKFRRKYSA